LEFLASADKPERKIDGFIATGKQKHGEHRLPARRGPFAAGRNGARSDDAEAADQSGQSRLRCAQVCGGAGVRADQQARGFRIRVSISSDPSVAEGSPGR
jgi:hypothetical protein